MAIFPERDSYTPNEDYPAAKRPYDPGTYLTTRYATWPEVCVKSGTMPPKIVVIRLRRLLSG